MSTFKNKIKNKKSIIGKRVVNSDEAMGMVFRNSKKKISSVKLNALKDNPYQPRKSIDQDELNGLSISIKENGLLQPIIITAVNNSSKEFYIVAGHRRVAACKLLNYDEIEAIIIQYNEENLRIYSILENLQRENLTTSEEAISMKALVDSGIKQSELVDKLGKNKSYISKMIKIATLNKDLIDYINSKTNLKIGISILFELTKISNEDQLKIFKKIEKKSMNRDEIKEYIRSLNTEEGKEKVSPVKLSPYIFNKKDSVFSMKFDINKIKNDDKQTIINKLEEVIEQLKV